MSDKLVKTSAEVTPANSFASAVKVAVDGAALARPALERCPACGNTNMRDAQAQFVGACSPTCAKALGVSDGVLLASGRVPPAQLATAARPDLCTCGHPAGRHWFVAVGGCAVSDCECRGFVKAPVVDLLAPETPPPCRKCGGCGSVSVPGALADTQCSACWGTGVDDRNSAIDPVVVRPSTLQFRTCGATSPIATTDGRRAACSRLIDHEGSHAGNVEGVDGIVTWRANEVANVIATCGNIPTNPALRCRRLPGHSGRHEGSWQGLDYWWGIE